MAFHFFTGKNSINSKQLKEMAFGSLTNEGNLERYNLENKFSVSANSPAFAITKSLIIAVEDASNPALLNIATLPIESNYLAGFPIKFFIYRGISKSSLLDGNNKVKKSGSTWESSNILKIIQDLQAKINKDNNTDEKANSSSLGLQFNALSNDTMLESLFFDELDNFHPLIVPRGCQIGKFAGGDANQAGMEVILDKIGSEAQLQLLKASSHILQVEKIDVTGLNEKEKLKAKFKNRLAKEEVLAYMDITAFYGACENQGYRVKGVLNNKNYLNRFFNRKTVYIDVRDERGFSYNHFFKLEDNVNIGFYNGNEKELVYDNIDYYADWPILKLKNQKYKTSKRFFYLKLPMLIGMPVNANVLTAFTKKVSIGKSKRNIRYKLLNQIDRDDNISFKETEPIRLKNWEYSDDSLGANYFLLKLDRIQNTDKSQILAPIWNSFFSLKMNPVFGLDNIEDGEFRIKTYASINTPLLTNNGSSEIYYSTAGIAVDKVHVTFFSFYRESAHKLIDRNDVQISKAIDTGKFKYSFDADKLNYEDQGQAVGFLYQIMNNDSYYQRKLSQFSFSDNKNGITDAKFLKYTKSSNLLEEDVFLNNFETITLTHEEYNHLMNLQKATLQNADYISEHPMYIKSSKYIRRRYAAFNFIETFLTIGAAKVKGEDSGSDFDLVLSDYPNPIEINGEHISFNNTL